MSTNERPEIIRGTTDEGRQISYAEKTDNAGTLHSFYSQGHVGANQRTEQGQEAKETSWWSKKDDTGTKGHEHAKSSGYQPKPRGRW